MVGRGLKNPVWCSTKDLSPQSDGGSYIEKSRRLAPKNRGLGALSCLGQKNRRGTGLREKGVGQEHSQRGDEY